MKKEIYLFRHGHSQANAERFRKIPIQALFIFIRKIFGFSFTVKLIKIIDLLRGHNSNYPIPDKDTPLEPLGIEQAELTGKVLAEKNILPDLILCSDYLRTRQTTKGIISGIKKHVSQEFDVQVLYSTLIVERDGGYEYGYPLSYYPVLFPETNEMYHKSPKLDFCPPGGESIRDVRYNRVPTEKVQLQTNQLC
jgi:broad specificity phosphatase PhoE